MSVGPPSPPSPSSVDSGEATDGKGSAQPAPTAITPLEGAGAEAVFEQIVGACGDAGLVVGAGNIGGIGLDLVSYFANRGRRRRPTGNGAAAQRSGAEA